MKYLTAFIAAILLATAVGAETEYYVWIDENGVTNYSERNPQGVDATYIGPQRRDAAGRPGGRPGAVETEPEPEAETEAQDPTESTGDEEIDQELAERRAAIDARIEQTRRQNCEIGKRNLAQMQAFARIRVTDENGQERVLSDAEKNARIAEARATIRENCTSG